MRGSLFLGIIIVMLFGVSRVSNAQHLAGAGLYYGFDKNEGGFSIHGHYSYNDRTRFGLEFVNYIIGDKNVGAVKLERSMRELNSSAHYILLTKDQVEIYLLANIGLHFEGRKINGDSEMDLYLGMGLGGGAHYHLGGLTLYAEPKVFFTGFSQAVLNIGVRLRI